jgi:hypothetical protein
MLRRGCVLATDSLISLRLNIDAADLKDALLDKPAQAVDQNAAASGPPCVAHILS